MQISATNPMGEDRCGGRKEKTERNIKQISSYLSHKNKPGEKCY